MMSKRLIVAVCMLLIGSALVACGGQATEPSLPTETVGAEDATPEPVPPQEEAVPTTEPTAEPPPTVAADVTTFAAVELPDAGVTVEVPSTWVRLEPDAVWVPEVTEAPAAMVHPRIGVKMVALEPPAEAEAVLLPQPAQVLEGEPVDSALGSGRSFVVEVYGLTAEGEAQQGDVISVERHVVISVMQGDQRLAYDFYAAAASAENLASLETVVAHMAQTAALTPMAMPVQGGQANLDIPAVIQAKARLAQHLNVPEGDITAVSAEFVDWPDACLGVRSAEQMCAQVITPGYRIMLETGGQQYEVHTDRNGSAVAILSP